MTIYNQYNDFVDNLINYGEVTNEIKISFNKDEISNIIGNFFRITQQSLNAELVKKFKILSFDREICIQSSNNSMEGSTSETEGSTSETLLKIKIKSQEIMPFLSLGWKLPDFKLYQIWDKNTLEDYSHLTKNTDNLEVYMKPFNEYDHYEILLFNRIIESVAIQKGLFRDKFNKKNKIELRYDVLNENSDKSLYIIGENANILDLIETLRCQMLPQKTRTLVETCTKIVFNHKASFESRFHEIPLELVEKIEAYPIEGSRYNLF